MRRRGRVGIHRGVRRDVQCQRGFSHAGPRREDDQIRRLKTRSERIEILEAGRHAGDQLAILIEPFEDAQRFARQLRHRVEGRLDAALGNFEDAMLGGIEELVDVGVGLVGARGDIGGDRREAAQHGLLAHDARVVRDVGGGRDRIGQFRDVAGPADLLRATPLVRSASVSVIASTG